MTSLGTESVYLPRVVQLKRHMLLAEKDPQDRQQTYAPEETSRTPMTEKLKTKCHGKSDLHTSSKTVRGNNHHQSLASSTIIIKTSQSYRTVGPWMWTLMDEGAQNQGETPTGMDERNSPLVGRPP